jgi:epoxyqueuosine reductase QueG
MFRRLQSIVGPSHALPKDLLKGAETVIAFFLPFTRAMARSNIEGKFASREWADAYLETNRLIHDASERLKVFLEANRSPVVTIPATHNFNPKTLTSDWSHRHVAFVAGLGRFGYNNMLITEKGCCGRFGSLVTQAEIEPDPRPTQETCLFWYDGLCQKCVERCVNDALLRYRFDRWKCSEMCQTNHERLGMAAKVEVCGKCLVGVPCSHTNPVRTVQT